MRREIKGAGYRSSRIPGNSSPAAAFTWDGFGLFHHRERDYRAGRHAEHSHRHINSRKAGSQHDQRDYLWGQSAERLLFAAAKAGKDAVPIRFVQIGSLC
jgi:hypothetical protein